MKQASILIIDPVEDNNFGEYLETLSNFTVIGRTVNADIGYALAEKHQPDLILLNIDLSGNKGFALAEIFALEFPDSALILMTGSDDKKVLRHALRIGAKDVISLPIAEDKILRLLTRALQQENERKALYTVEKKAKPQFKTITVFSTKGGVGKTTVALNLAVAIHQITGKRTALVDLNLMAGNIALMAGINPRFTFKDLVDEISLIDSEVLEQYCIEHFSGIRILAAPLNPEVAGFIHSEHVEKVLELLSETYNYVIIDAPNYFHDTVIPALEFAQDIALVTTFDLASVQNLKQCLDVLASLNLRKKVKIIINRMSHSAGLKLKDLQKELGVVVTGVIPNSEKIAVNAVNMGNPLYISARSSAISQNFEALATKMIGYENRNTTVTKWNKTVPKWNKLFSRWRG